MARELKEIIPGVGSQYLIATDELAAGAVDAAAIAAGAVGSSELAADAVIAGKIAAGAISAAGDFAAGVVDSTALAASAVIAGKIAVGGVSAANQFAAGVVDSSALAASAVIAGKIAVGGVSAANQFAAGVVDATAIATGAVGTPEVALTTAPTATGQVGLNGTALEFYDGSAAQQLKKKADTVLYHIKLPATGISTYTAATAATLVRNAQGDLSLNRTAGAAETHYFYPSVLPCVFTDEASKGVRLDAVRVAYQIGVADATSVDILVDSVAYVQATAPAVTASHGGAIVDGDYDTDHDTAAERADKDVAAGEHVLELSLNTPVFFNSISAVPIVEFAVVLANTGTLKVRSMELEFSLVEPNV